MNIEQAVELIYTGLVSEESVPVKLRAYHELDRELLAQVQEALDFAIEYYKGEPLIPKNWRRHWLIFTVLFTLTAVLVKMNCASLKISEWIYRKNP